jgi:hypothetical protein
MNIDFDVDVDEVLFDEEKINKLEIEGALKKTEFQGKNCGGRRVCCR